jgi:P27 family predicted phage terminase small subunit
MPPIPTHLKLLRGNPGHQKLNPEPEPVAPKELPEPPELLDEVAQNEWWKIGCELHRLGLLTVIDFATFEAYCECYSQWWHARAALRKMAANDPNTNALMVKGSLGNPIVNPLVKIAALAARDMVQYAGQLGCTPVARARIAAGGFTVEEPPSKFGRLLTG